MNSSKTSNIILDSEDDEMDEIIAEFAEEEGKEQIILLSESEDEIDNLIEEFAASESEDEIDNLIEEFAAAESKGEIDNLNDEFATVIDNIEVENVSEENSLEMPHATTLTGDRDCTGIYDKNNDSKNIYSSSDKASDENSSLKDSKESCDIIENSSRNVNFLLSSKADLSKITSDNSVTKNENKSTNQNLFKKSKCDITEKSDLGINDKEVHKNCFTQNNGFLDVTNNKTANKKYIVTCDKNNESKTIYSSASEILEENSNLKKSPDSIESSNDASSLSTNDFSKPSYNVASNNISDIKPNRTDSVIDLSKKESVTKFIENVQTNDTNITVQELQDVVDKDSSVGTVTKLDSSKKVADEHIINTETNIISEDIVMQSSDLNDRESHRIKSPILCKSLNISLNEKFVENRNGVNDELIISSNMKDTEKNFISHMSEKICPKENFLKHSENLSVKIQPFPPITFDSSLKKDRFNPVCETEVTMENLELSGNIDETSSSEKSSISAHERDLLKDTPDGTMKISAEGSSNTYVLSAKDSSIPITSNQASDVEMLNSDIINNDGTNRVDSKEVLEKGISVNDKRKLEISENEFSHKRLRKEITNVITTCESSLDLPDDFNSIKNTNLEELVSNVTVADIKAVDRINELIPWDPGEKIETTKKTLDRIALYVCKEVIKECYKEQYSQGRNEVKILEKKIEKLTDDFQNFRKLAKEFSFSQKVSFSNENFKKISTRTVSVNVKIIKESFILRTLIQRTITETLDKNSDQKQDVSLVATVPEVSGVSPDQKQAISLIETIPKSSENSSDPKQDVSLVMTIAKVTGINSDQGQDVSPIAAIYETSGNKSDQKEDVSLVATIPKASENKSDQKQDVSLVATIPKASENKSDQKEDVSLVATIPKASENKSDQKQDVSLVATIPKASENKSDQKQDVSLVATIPKASENSPFEKQSISFIETIPKASENISVQKQDVSLVATVPKTSGNISFQKKDVSLVATIPKASGNDLPKNSSPSCINLSSSQGAATSQIIPSIPTPLPLPHIMEGDRLIPYINPSKPLPSNKSLVPFTVAVTTAPNCQITDLQKKQYEQNGAVSNGVSIPINNFMKAYPNVQPQQAFLPVHTNSFKSAIINPHVSQRSMKQGMPSFLQPRFQPLRFLQMNSTGADVNLNPSANSITKTSSLSHQPHGSKSSPPVSLFLFNHPQKDSQSSHQPLPRFHPPVRSYQTSVPYQGLSVTVPNSSRVMHQITNSAYCRSTYVHQNASPVISSHSTFIRHNPLSVNQSYLRSHQPYSRYEQYNPLQFRHPSATPSSYNSLPRHLQPHLSSNRNTCTKEIKLPKPIVKGTVKDDGSVVISWNLPSSEQQPNIALYQIFSCQAKDPPGSPPIWKNVGDVASLDLPMACTLRHFEENTYYNFIVRVVDKRKHYGPFSNPVTIHYSKRNDTSPKV